jgi:hypothetical protein
MSSATPPAPNMGQIPLPPGFTLEQFLTLQGQLGMKCLFPTLDRNLANQGTQ